MIEVTGGARIDGLNATWPLAKLVATPDYIEVKAALIGGRKYRPDEVERLEIHKGFISKGVRICSTNNAEETIFWCFGDPQKIIEQVYKVGFKPTKGINDA